MSLEEALAIAEKGGDLDPVEKWSVPEDSVSRQNQKRERLEGLAKLPVDVEWLFLNDGKIIHGKTKVSRTAIGVGQEELFARIMVTLQKDLRVTVVVCLQKKQTKY